MRQASHTPESTAETESLPVKVPFGNIVLEADLCIPQNTKGIVVFAHGSGSSRFSPRNRFVAEVLHEHDVGTLLLDLLTAEEEAIDRATAQLRFDIPFLAERLESAGAWVLSQPRLENMKLGYFGASTGGAAALIAAVAQPDKVAAVVVRGGRPDLAMEVLPEVKAPTLLIVGGHDPQVLEWNKQALKLLNDRSRLEIVPRATHLFEEPGALEIVAQMAAEWFAKYLA